MAKGGIGNIYVALGLSSAGFVKALNEARRRLGVFGKSTKTASTGVLNLKNNLKGLGGIVGAAFATRAIMSFTNQASQLDKQIREVGTLMGGLTNNEIRGMKAEMEKLSLSSGQAMDVLTKARYDIVSAGFGSAAESAQMLETASKLAVGGVTEVSTAADLLTTVVNAYNLSASDAAGVSDDLFTIVKNGKTTITEIASSFGRLAAIAAPMGVSLDEAGAALSALTAQGQSTEESVTAVRAAIIELSKPSKELVGALKEIGVEETNLIKAGNGLAGALDLVKQASEKTGIPLNELLSNVRSMQAVLPLTSNAADKFSNDLASMSQNAGASDQAFKQMAESAAFLQDQVVRTFESAQRAVGEAIISNEDYRQLLLDVRDAVGQFADKIREGDPAFDKFVSQIAMLGSAVVKNIPGYIDGVTGAVSRLNAVLIPMINFVGRNPEVLEYGLIGLVFGGKKFMYAGAALGSAVGSLRSGEREAERLADERERIARIVSSSTGPITGGMVDLGEISKFTSQSFSALNKAGGDVNKMLQSMGKESKKSGDSVEKLGGKTGGTTKASREAARAQEQLARELERAEEWYLRETEAIEGLYDKKKENATAMEKLELLYKFGRISIDQFVEGVERADNEFQLFLASMDAVLQHDIDVMLRENTDLFGDFGDAAKKTGNDVADTYEKIAQGIGDFATVLGNALDVNIKGVNNLQNAITAFGPNGGGALVGGLNVASFLGQNIGGGVGSAISGAASGALAGLSIGGPIGGIIGGGIGLISSLFGGGDYERQRQEREQARSQTYESLVGLAGQGGLVSRGLLRAGGNTYQGVSDLQFTPEFGQKYGLVWEDRFMASYGRKHAAAMAQNVAEVDAYFIMLNNQIHSALSAATFEEGAASLRTNIEAALDDALKKVVITSLMEEILLPQMLPIISSLRSVVEAEGRITAEQIAGYRDQAAAVADMAMPVFEAVYDIFGAANNMSSQNQMLAVNSSGNLVSASSNTTTPEIVIEPAQAEGITEGLQAIVNAVVVMQEQLAVLETKAEEHRNEMIVTRTEITSTVNTVGGNIGNTLGEILDDTASLDNHINIWYASGFEVTDTSGN